MKISIVEALETGTGRGVKIGVLDTGIAELAEFGDSVVAHYQVVDRDRKISVIRNEVGFDDISHGTACADVIHRYVPDAELYDIKVMDYKSENSRYKIGAGIRYGAELGLDILNLCVGTQIDYTRLREVVQDANDAGMMVISAIDCDAESIGYPAAYPNVVSVDYDQFDSPLDYQFNSKADICGQGVYVTAITADGEVEAFTGSSFACPHITALAARAREYHPHLSGHEFIVALKALKSQLPC